MSACHRCSHSASEHVTPPPPVTYPGGTQWAIKRNDFPPNYRDNPVYEAGVRESYDEVLRIVKGFHPDNPELWPELVRAEITWQAVQ